MKVHELVFQFLFSSWTVVSGSCVGLDLDFRCQASVYMWEVSILHLSAWKSQLGDFPESFLLWAVPVIDIVLGLSGLYWCPCSHWWLKCDPCWAAGSDESGGKQWTEFSCDWHALHISFNIWTIPVSGKRNQEPTAAFAPNWWKRSSTRGRRDPDSCA